MFRNLPLRFSIGLILALATIGLLGGYWLGSFENDVADSEANYLANNLVVGFRIALTTVSVVFTLLSFPLVWNFVWRWILGPIGVFPYINGTYSVSMEHNWPAIGALIAAARSDQPIDVSSGDYEVPSLGVGNFEARVKIGFLTRSLEVRPTSSELGTVISWSRALSVDLLPPCDGLPHRLMYIFKQENDPRRVQNTDTAAFYGAAILDIHRPESLFKTVHEFDGVYWSNRAWQRGFNTAGLVTFRRQPKTVS